MEEEDQPEFGVQYGRRFPVGHVVPLPLGTDLVEAFRANARYNLENKRRGQNRTVLVERVVTAWSDVPLDEISDRK